MKSLSQALDTILNLNEEKDAPKLFKHDGLNKKTASGAHRFDDGIKFTQMRHDDQFKNGSVKNYGQ
jgi:hypothetical protein